MGKTRENGGRHVWSYVEGCCEVTPGGIIVRQRGTKFYPGENVGIGKDYTLYAKCEGVVAFEYKTKRNRQYVTVKSLPEDDEGQTPTMLAQQKEKSGGDLTRKEKNLLKYAELGRPGSRQY